MIPLQEKLRNFAPVSKDLQRGEGGGGLQQSRKVHEAILVDGAAWTSAKYFHSTTFHNPSRISFHLFVSALHNCVQQQCIRQLNCTCKGLKGGRAESALAGCSFLTENRFARVLSQPLPTPAWRAPLEATWRGTRLPLSTFVHLPWYSGNRNKVQQGADSGFEERRVQRVIFEHCSTVGGVHSRLLTLPTGRKNISGKLSSGKRKYPLTVSHIMLGKL